MGWVDELTEENFFAIYDVALDIRSDLQLGQAPSISMVPSVVRFPILMPVDGINMRDRYGNLRWKAMKFLEGEGIIQKIELEQSGHRWESRAELAVDVQAFNGAFAELEAEASRRLAPDKPISDDIKPWQEKEASKPPEFDKITLLWLVHHLPLKLWISAIVLATALFLAGIKVGQVSVVRELLGAPAPGASIEPSVLSVRIDQLTESYGKNVATITAQIVAEEEAAGRTPYPTEQQPHVDAASRLRALLNEEHKKYREAISELRGLQQKQ